MPKSAPQESDAMKGFPQEDFAADPFWAVALWIAPAYPDLLSRDSCDFNHSLHTHSEEFLPIVSSAITQVADYVGQVCIEY